LVSEYQPAYVQARKRDKTIIAKTIVARVRSRNGRFLRKENGKWVDVGDKKAAEKTSQALREGLSGRMREIVKQGGVGLQKLKKIGFSLYEDNITREDVQRRLKSSQKSPRTRVFHTVFCTYKKTPQLHCFVYHLHLKIGNRHNNWTID
jgi:hypothetical protein